MHGEVDIDLDEGESGRLGRPWASESEANSIQGEEEEHSGRSVDRFDVLGYSASQTGRQVSISFDRTARVERADRTAPSEHTERPDQQTPRSPSADRSREDSGRLSRILQVERAAVREDSAAVSLPPLPSHDVSAEDDDGNVLSERRAALFGSDSRSRSSLSPRLGTSITSPVHTKSSPRPKSLSPNLSRTSEAAGEASSRYNTPERSRVTSEQDPSASHSRSDSSLHLQSTAFPSPPARAGLTVPLGYTKEAVEADVATPSRSTPVRSAPGDINTGATPHPPGWLSRSPRSVRFSPLRQTDKDWSVTNSSKDEVSVHRLRLSPAKSSPLKHAHQSSSSTTTPPPKARQYSNPKAAAAATSADPDQSFTARVASFFLPQPSTTWKDASAELDMARRASELAQLKVDESRAAWMDALGQLRDSAGPVVKQGAGWSNWAWWICVEVMLLWAVFR